ncbi:MAG: long-chain-fatty-acid--CoA ligase [Dehalococcoidia bacterium]|nr:long-chain-fatty-acid--CoA ligase [Dehalococcoidia bacterium]
MQTLRELLNRNAQTYSDKTAFIFENKRYTFKQVNQRVNSLTNALASIGVRKGDRVGILAYNCPQYFEVFNVAKAGMVCVPLNYRFVGRELAYLINNSEANTLILEKEFLNSILPIRHELKGVKNFICLDAALENMMSYEQLISNFPPDEPVGEVGEDDPCILFYTSGTTGRPKGAIHTNKSLLAEAATVQHGFTSSDIALCVMPLFHVAGSAAYLFPAFSSGATMVILKKFEETLTLETIEREKVTNICLVPTMFIRLLEYVQKYDLRSLQAINFTGSPMPLEALRRGIEHFGKIFVQLLGQTETLNLTILEKEDHNIEGSAKEIKRLESVGKPARQGELRIVDEQGRDVPVGQVGEIIARSDRMMKGYWKMPKETAETIRDGWLHTGDMGRMDEDGYIYLVDRKKDMIISGAENIYSREVEEVLYMHPAVFEAAVVGVPDEEWGESVKAVIALKQGAVASEEKIIDFCKQHLASYKKPKSVEFWDNLPKTPSGKIRKNVIRDRYWKGYEKKVH